MSTETRPLWRRAWEAIGHIALVLDIRAWIASALVATGVGVAFRNQPPVVVAALAIATLALCVGAFSGLPAAWDWFQIRQGRKRRALRYLSNRTSELSTAVYTASFRSAWADWFRNQHVPKGGEPLPEQLVLSALAHLVLEKAMNGTLTISGRPPKATSYEPIAADIWRLAALHVVADPVVLWRVTVMPRHQVDPKRIARVLAYDSLTVDSEQFESLWPRDKIAE